MTAPLIVLRGLRRDFRSGDGFITALKDIDLTTHAGEMVAIVGASGSGKSTLMHILGCLDRPTAGSYRIAGCETAGLEPDALAGLRRERFGFIFQRYHLLSALTALGNVEMPATYAGLPRRERTTHAGDLLARLGLSDRLGHRSSQLSGGQQQRVSIARALINGAEIVLADEPTGALDRQSGEEVLRILEGLNTQGRTIVIVTHDMGIARRARRIIELSDGEIIADRRNAPADSLSGAQAACPVSSRFDIPPIRKGWGGQLGRLREAFAMALHSMRAHALRTILTMLGIIIGIASVVSVVALGQGSQQQVLANISSLGTNTLEIFPGQDFGDVRSGKIKTLVVADARALAQQAYVAGVTPTVSTNGTLRSGSREASALVNGVGEEYFRVKGTKLREGRLFDADAVRGMAQEVVIDENARQALFADLGGSPVGQVIFIGRVPCRVIGVTRKQQGGFGASQSPSVYLPYTTVQARFLGSPTLRSITVRVDDATPTDVALAATTQLLTERHGTKDFFVLNTDDIRRTINRTIETMTLLIAAIAVISLVVGGIGVMNIMLVSVTERTGEIGIRMAVGARPSDILQQFLIEAVLVCLLGGLLGIAAALGFGVIFAVVGGSFPLIYSATSIVVAVVCSTLIGVVFGYLPARNASRLDPIAALASD